MPAANFDQKIKSWLIGISVILIIILINLFYLDWQLFNQEKTPVVLPPSEVVLDCPEACQDLIGQITPATNVVAPTTVITSVPRTGVKEYFITFGTGSSRASDWEDLGGVEAYIDKGQYGKIKEVVFEAGMKIPNGNQGAYARLYNVTDKHPVWFSEVYLEGGAAMYLVSSPITLDEGKKLYRVQLKTTLKDLVNLNSSRLKITLY